MRFQLLIGKLVAPDRALPAAASDSSALRRQAADALAAYYERDEMSFWPKPRFRAGAPETVRIIGEHDEILAQYTILDYAADTGCVFVHRKQGDAGGSA